MRSLVFSAKLLLAFAVIAIAEPRHPMSPEKEAAKDACLKKLGMTEDKRPEIRESGEDGKDISCFVACMAKELGIMTAEGNIDREMALKDFPPPMPQENRTAIVDACYKKKGADECETAKLYHMCVEKMKPRPPMNPEFKKIHDGCKEELSLTDEDLEKMKDSVGKNKKDCFLTCIGKGIGYLNEDESLNGEKLIEKLPPHLKEAGQKITEECASAKSADECESVVLIHECIRNSHFPIGELLGHPHPYRPRQD